MKLKSLFLLSIGFFLILPSYGQDVKSILKTSEEKRRGVESSVAEMSMTIVRPTWRRTMNMKSWSKGEDYALILILGPDAKQKGTATLKRKREVWNWLPRVERTMKLPPSMMSQSWMGSDLSNDDLVREISLVTDYDSKILGEESILGRKCWKIELIPHDDVAIVWAKVIMYIDQQDYLQMKTEFIDEDDEMVNVFKATEIKELGGRTLASKMELIPLEEEGKKTILEYKSIEFDVPMKDTFFSVQNMKRVR